LTAAENADGRAGLQHVTTLIKTIFRPLVPAPRPSLASAGSSPPKLRARRRKVGIQKTK
jgi:hypothetical protein